MFRRMSDFAQNFDLDALAAAPPSKEELEAKRLLEEKQKLLDEQRQREELQRLEKERLLREQQSKANVSEVALQAQTPPVADDGWDEWDEKGEGKASPQVIAEENPPTEESVPTKSDSSNNGPAPAGVSIEQSQEIDTLRQKLQKMMEACKQLKQIVLVREMETEELKTALHAEKEARESFSDKHEQVVTHLKEAEGHIAKNSAERVELEAALANEIEAREELSLRVEEGRTVYKELQNMRTSAMRSMEEHADLEAKLATQIEENQQYAREVEHMRAVVHTLSSEKEDLHTKLSEKEVHSGDIPNGNSELMQEIEQLRCSLETLRAEKLDLQKTLDSERTQENRDDDVSGKIQELSSEISTLRAELETARAINVDLETALQSSTDVQVTQHVNRDLEELETLRGLLATAISEKEALEKKVLENNNHVEEHMHAVCEDTSSSIVHTLQLEVESLHSTLHEKSEEIHALKIALEPNLVEIENMKAASSEHVRAQGVSQSNAQENLEKLEVETAAAEAGRQALAAAEKAMAAADEEISELHMALAASQQDAAQKAKEVTALQEELEASQQALNEIAEQAGAQVEDVNRRADETNQLLEQIRKELVSTKRELNTLRETSALDKEARLGAEVRLRQMASDAEQRAREDREQKAQQQKAYDLERRNFEDQIAVLTKDKDRIKSELSLQQARRKEAAEKAKMLEATMASADRESQGKMQEIEAKLREAANIATELDQLKAQRHREQASTAADIRELRALLDMEREKHAVALQSTAESVRSEANLIVSELEASLRATNIREEAIKHEAQNSRAGAEKQKLALEKRIEKLETESIELKKEVELGNTAQKQVLELEKQLKEYQNRAQAALRRSSATAVDASSRLRVLEDELEITRIDMEEAIAKAGIEKENAEVAKAEALKSANQLAALEQDMVAQTLATETKISEVQAACQAAEARASQQETKMIALGLEISHLKQSLTEAKEREDALRIRAEKSEKLVTSERRTPSSAQKGPGQHQLQQGTFLESSSHSLSQHPASPHEGVAIVPATPPDSPTTTHHTQHTGGRREEYTRQNSMRKGSNSNATARMSIMQQQHQGRVIPRPPSFTLSNAGSIGVQDLEGIGALGLEVEVDGEDGWSIAAGGGNLLYVTQLEEARDREQTKYQALMRELETALHTIKVSEEREAKIKTELEGYVLGEKRKEVLNDSSTASVNLEYLKNCIFRYLSTSEPSEHSRLLPVISTILQLSASEQQMVAAQIEKEKHLHAGVVPVASLLSGWKII